MNTIIHMHHSPLYDHELETAPLPHQRDVNRLYREMIQLYGLREADRLARSLAGCSYQQVCAAFIAALSDADSRSIHQK